MTKAERHCQVVMESQKRFPDRLYARQAVRRMVKRGGIPRPSELKCSDCGETAACYDHAKGYAKEHRLCVEPVCWPCHRSRGMKRGEYKNGATYGWKKTDLNRMSKSCPACKQVFSGVPSTISNRKYCSKKCYGRANNNETMSGSLRKKKSLAGKKRWAKRHVPLPVG